MSHKLSVVICLCVCLLGTTVSLWGQNAAAAHGIMGYLDPKTNAFHPLPVAVDQDGEPPATSTVTGKFVANFTITVDSTVASTAKIGCEFEATLVDVTTGNTLFESAASAVTRGSGTTVTCTATIPYSWTLGSASTDKVSLSWGILSPVTTSAAAPSGFPFRVSQHSMGTISVPANGATTTETIAATI